MADEINSGKGEDKEFDSEELLDQNGSESVGSGKYEKLIQDGENKYKLTGMFKNWFLDYASYVILERAVPHIADGLKPVQRRILHAMKRVDDGRYNKVANIIGQTMQFHPHGDASIGDALVQLGQKDLLVDCQGNWGNILTGDSAAAPRYIEARLSKFANEVVFNPKTTEWMSSYDGRNEEPVNLPVKFPLLLAQGSEGIAVGLSSKILPHNFNELIDSSIAYLKEKPFELFPDFPTGGIIDCTGYNDGKRGGRVRIRAKIQKIDKKTLVIDEIPFGKTTSVLIESILKANDKGKIKIKKIDDNTAGSAEIVIHLANDVSPDKTIDALYAFTDCEVPVAVNACVIEDQQPKFLTVKEILIYNTNHTKELLRRELEIRQAELENDWHYLSLEKLFFENKKYRLLEQDAKSWEAQIKLLHKEMMEYEELLHKPIVMEDILKLVEKPVRKISKFDVKEVDTKIKKIEEEMKEVLFNLAHLVDYTIKYYEHLKERYGKAFPRKTEVTGFETIQGKKVAVANAKLYMNSKEGFVGMDLKKDDSAEYVCECSDIDDIIVFLKDGRYIVTKVSDKIFIGKDIIYAGVFNKGDNRTIYNVVYRDGKGGITYVKRFSVTSVTRDKEYDLTQGKPDSQLLWFTANHNGEAEVLKVFLRPRPKLKKLLFEFDFASIAVKGRASMGNILSKNPVHKVQLKSKGLSTIGGKPLWFDTAINRLNEEQHGIYLGEFHNDDHLLTIFKEGTFYTTNYDLSNRYQGEIEKIEKFNTEKTYSAIYYDGEAKSYYVKRFSFEYSDNNAALFISDAKGSEFIAISDDAFPRIELVFGGKHNKRPNEIVDVAEFIGKKSFKAKGKRLTTYETVSVSFIEPIIKEELNSEEENENGGGENGLGSKTDGGAVENNKTRETERAGEGREKDKSGFAPGTTTSFDPKDFDDGQPSLFDL
jgi:topoisomerase IV subunit A